MLRKQILCSMFALGMVGCSTETVAVQTPSGEAEAVFDGTTTSALAGKLSSFCLNRGLQIESQTSYQLECSKATEGMQSAGVYLLLGNNTNNPRYLLQFQMAQAGNDVRVVERTYAEAELPNGRVTKAAYSNPSIINMAQSLLSNLGGHPPT